MTSLGAEFAHPIVGIPNVWPPPKLAITRFAAHGQDLHSYLEQIARDNHVTLLKLVQSIGLRRFNRQHAYMDNEHLPLIHLAESTSCSIDDIAAMTFAPVMDLRGLHSAKSEINSASDVPSLRMLWTRVLRRPGARFCPQCLDERDGAWKTRWFFTIDTVCLRHLTLLVDRCPRCGNTPRHGENRDRSDPASPTRCMYHDPTWVKTADDRRPGLCGTDLSTVPAISLDLEHPVVRTQRLLDQVSGLAGTPSETMLCGTMVPPGAALSAIVALALRIAAQRIKLESAISSEISPGRRLTKNLPYSTEQIGPAPGAVFTCQGDAASFAPLLAAASDVFCARDFASAADVLERYFDLNRDYGAVQQEEPQDSLDEQTPVSATPKINQQHIKARLLEAVELAGRAANFKPAQHLSYRTITGIPRRPGSLDWPHPVNSQVSVDPAYLPQTLWPEATALLPALTLKDSGAMRVSASLILARIGTEKRWTSIAHNFLLPATTARTVSAHLSRLRDAGLYTETMYALDSLWEELVQAPPAINYARRRWEFLIWPTPTSELIRKLDWNPRSEKKRDFLAIHMWELLTGGDARFHLTQQPLRAGADRSDYKSFLLKLSTKEDAAIRAECSRILWDREIDEPLTWCPASLNQLDPTPGDRPIGDHERGSENNFATTQLQRLTDPVSLLSMGGRPRRVMLCGIDVAITTSPHPDLWHKWCARLKHRSQAENGAQIGDVYSVANEVKTLANNTGTSLYEICDYLLDVVEELDEDDYWWEELLGRNFFDDEVARNFEGYHRRGAI